MKIKEILREIELYAPLPLQDSYDKSGIQVGDINLSVTGILVCVDVTEEVLEEALDLQCNLIISHHPLLFKPLHSLTGKTYIERCVQKACKHDLVIYAAHTNLDNVSEGVSFRMARKLGLQQVEVLSPKENELLKLVTFVPSAQANEVRNALFGAGAGHIGNYDSCSYNLEGTGSFRAGEHTDPFCGEKGRLHWEPEVRIETVLPAFRKRQVTEALLLSHPYEEPAFDLYPLLNSWKGAGAGAVGELLLPLEEPEFLQQVKDIFRLKCLKHSSLRDKPVKKVAVCGGSGAFLISRARAVGADVFITGEAKYNDYYDVEKNLLLAVIGHYESEECTKELFFEIITKKLPNFVVHFSKANTNPVNYL